jgi:hypothetical protein
VTVTAKIGKKKTKTAVLGFIGEAANSKTSSAIGLAMLKWQLAIAARLEAVRRSPATAGGGALRLEADFNYLRNCH